MKIIRAKTAGFCMGVSLALQKLDNALEKYSGRICTLGPIIHNPQVLEHYAKNGVSCLKSSEDVCNGDIVVIRAHGIVRKEEEALKNRGIVIIDATCPKVKKAQISIKNATENGKRLLLFGEESHPEVRGLVSYAGSDAYVFGSMKELVSLDLDKNNKYVLASQTTQDINIFLEIKTYLKNKFPDLVILETICGATSERQEEARDIASYVDVMIIIGGRESGNTRRLADVAALKCPETYLCERIEELDEKKFKKNLQIGLTAGASTPKSLIEAAEKWLTSLRTRQ